MLDSILDLLMYPSIIFSEILEELDLFGFLIGGFLIVLSYRFLLKPIFGGRFGSDSAKKNKNNNSEDR